MRIDRIKLNNYKKFGAFEVPLDPQFNLFVGDNASGKTTILDAITVGLDSWFIGMKGVQGIGSIDQDEVHVIPHPYGDVVSFEKQFPAEVQFEGLVMGRKVSWSRELARDGGRTTTVGAKALAEIAADADDQVRQGKPVTLPLVCTYGTERLWFESPQRKRESKREPVKQFPSRFDGYRNCTAFEIQETDLLKWIRAEVSASQQRRSETTALTVIKGAIVDCVEDAEDVYYDERYKELIVVMKQLGHQMFSNLSDGQRVMLTFIGDLAKRAVTLNPHLEKDVLKQTPGVVSIDELDLHLHPRWQRRVIHDLKKTFPKFQFIATTHSPQLVGEALPHEIRILEEGSVTTPTRSFGIDSSRILEEVMHASPRNEETKDLLARMAELIDREDLHGAKALLKEVEEKLGRPSARLADRARAEAGRVERTKNMVLYYLLSRELKKIEGYQFTLRAQKNSQDSVRITDEGALPKSYCKIDARIDGVLWETVLSLLPDELSRSLESSVQETRPNSDTIKAAAMRNEHVPGAEVRRGSHLRVA